jgi:hypothetical protein
LDSILGQLDRVYRLGLDVDIHDYVISSETCARFGVDAAHGAVVVRHAPSEGEVQLGLYLEEESIRRLSEIDLTADIGAENFEALVTAIEEVSHFAYLMFSAERERSVTQLELELQAEVDKYVTSLLLLASDDGSCAPRDLLDRVFGDFEVRRGLSPERRSRYEEATALASRYCSYALGEADASALQGPTRLRSLLSELRGFYRLTQTGKIGRIHRLVFRT